MKRIVLSAMLVVLAFLLVVTSCKDTTGLEEQATMSRVPASILPTGPDDTAGIERLIAWTETHPMPEITKNCAMQGPSLCNEVYGGVLFCRSVCGFNYWQLSEGCLVAATGESFKCP